VIGSSVLYAFGYRGQEGDAANIHQVNAEMYVVLSQLKLRGNVHNITHEWQWFLSGCLAFDGCNVLAKGLLCPLNVLQGNRAVLNSIHSDNLLEILNCWVSQGLKQLLG
jgi:hypothetical protein